MRLRDLSRNGKLVVRGNDRVRFLNGMFTNDVARLRPGEGCRAAMLSVKGRLLGDTIILCDESALRLDLDPSIVDKIRDTMERHAIVDEVEIEDRSAAEDEIGVYGDDARAALEAALGPLPDLPLWGHVGREAIRVVRTDDLGLPAYRLVGNETGSARAVADRLGAPASAWLDEAEAEILRVEAGQPRYGADMNEDHLPIESRLDDAISHTKGCYMGQEVIARATARGQINKKLVGLRLDGDRPAGRGTKLRGGGREDAGTVMSSVISPRFGAIALAYVHRSTWAPGSELELVEPTGSRRAVVSELPFGA